MIYLFHMRITVWLAYDLAILQRRKALGIMELSFAMPRRPAAIAAPRTCLPLERHRSSSASGQFPLSANKTKRFRFCPCPPSRESFIGHS
jgi:hypothetical protein